MKVVCGFAEIKRRSSVRWISFPSGLFGLQIQQKSCPSKDNSDKSSDVGKKEISCSCKRQASSYSELSLEGQDFCWICNPNNPDGKLIHRTELLRLISANPQTTFIIDQAYVAFTTEDMLKPSDVKTHKNLILVQSISKAYNIPGLRIGYLVASPEIAEKVNKYIIPWSVNAISIEASKYILIHPS